MVQTESAGGIVVNAQGQILIVSQRGVSWSFPKGHLEPGEDHLTAARREIFEETGVSDLVLVKVLGTYTRPRTGFRSNRSSPELKTITLFLFRSGQERLEPQDPDNPEARWVSKEKVVQVLSNDKDKDFFQQILPEIELLLSPA